ncbi:MAG TPA: hypothetical protein VGH30_04340 [Jatrophihabitantaceae bacterium]
MEQLALDVVVLDVRMPGIDGRDDLPSELPAPFVPTELLKRRRRRTR